MRLLVLVVLLFVLTAAIGVGAATATDPESALVAVFVFGDTAGWMGCGFVVGDGGWVVTTADLVSETVGPKTAVTVKFVTVVSAWTGDAYRAEAKFVDRKLNLALLKLPVKGLPSVPLAGADGFADAHSATIGQVLSGDQVGAKWETSLYALKRETQTGKPAKLAVKQWTARNAALSESKGVNWLFLSRLNPEDNPPRAALLWRGGAGAVGVYNGRLVVGKGQKPATYGQCLPSIEIIKAFKSERVDEAVLRKVPDPTIPSNKTSAQALQNVWAALTNAILGRWPDAQKAAKALSELRPQNATAHLLLGVSLAGEGKAEEAIPSLNKAICLAPASPDAYFARALARASLKKTKEAEADLRTAAAKSPTDTKPLIALADLLSSDKARLAEAEGVAGKAVRLAPDHPGPKLTLALILKSRKSYDRAISELQAALAIAPNWGAAKAALAATYEAAGNLRLAEDQYRKLVESEPKNPDALFTLASFLADHDKKEEAKELLVKLFEMKPPKPLEEAAKKLQKKLEK